MFDVRPLTNRTWAELEELFALPGGSIVRGCWCMYYRKAGKVSVSQASGSGHKDELHTLVRSGVVPGLVGYADGSPVGWISLGPREDYRKLERSRIMKAVDDTPVWSIVCTYVAKTHRGKGTNTSCWLEPLTTRAIRVCGRSRHIPWTSQNVATTTSCSSGRGVCMSEQAFARWYAGRQHGW